MAYSDFKLGDLIENFSLKMNETSEMFADVPEVECSEILTILLKENVDLAVAINTEKARSEMIIAPILLEIRRKFNYNISLFSGVDFNVDFSQELNEFCDFLISRLKKQLFIYAPVLTIVKTKNENFKSGLGQVALRQFKIITSRLLQEA